MKSETRLVNFNGELVPEYEAKISIYDSTLMFGDMVFEMTRSFNKKQFKLEEHVSRLYAGIKILRIPVEISKQLIKECHRTIEANNICLMKTTSMTNDRYFKRLLKFIRA